MAREPVATKLARMKRYAGDPSFAVIARGMGKAGPSSIQRYFSPDESPGSRDSLPREAAEDFAEFFSGKGSPPLDYHDILASLMGFDGGENIDQIETNNGEAPLSGIRITELDVRSAGGAALFHEGRETIVAEWEMPRELLMAQTTAPSSEIRIIRVHGNSMAPAFLPGERIMVDTSDRTPSPPGVFVLWDGVGLVLKQVEVVPYSDPITLRLSSINPTYGAYERPMEEVVINGRVIGKWQWT